MSENIWTEILKILPEKVSSTSMRTWFSDCEYISFDGEVLELCAGSRLKKEVIEKRFSSTIKEILTDLGFSAGLRVYADREEINKEAGRKGSSEIRRFSELQGYSFDRFIVGDSNRFAYKAAVSAAREPGAVMCNPLFIYGGSGLGKTHLLCSIASYVAASDSSKTVKYVKGEDFTNQLVRSIKEKNSESFRNMFRDVDVLLVDDIQFLAGKEQTQEEFFNTFNALYQQGSQIVMTSDRPPRELSTLEERLRSRFEGGLMADIQQPEQELKRRLIEEKAVEAGVPLSEEDMMFISEHAGRNVRQIEGVMKSLRAYLEISGRLGRSEIERVLCSVADTSAPKITPDIIIAQSALYYGLKADSLSGPSHAKNISQARQIAMYLIRELTGLSLKDIGCVLGNRSHSTVLTGIYKVEQLLRTDADICKTVEDIELNIRNR